MALVERLPEQQLRDQHGSLESHAAASNAAITPASAAAPVQASESVSRLERWQRHPVAKLALKGAGVGALLVGLASIGAFSMKKGLTPKLALADSAHPAASASGASGWIASSHASLVGSAPTEPTVVATATASASARSSGLTEDGRVILNLASVEDLRHLPGVGQKRAEAILALRQKLGKFRRASDLLRVRGIGARRLKQLLPKLVVDAPSPQAATPAASASAAATTSLPSSTSLPSPSTSAGAGGGEGRPKK